MTAPDPSQAWLMANSMAYRLQHSDMTVDGQPFSLEDYPYVVEMLDETPRLMTIPKGAQMGLSVMAIAKSSEEARTLKLRSIMYFFPSDRQVSRFSKARTGPWLDNDLYRPYKTAVDSAELRIINNTALYFLAAGVRGTAASQSLANIKSTPADRIVLDESDEMEQSRVAAIRHRLDSSAEPAEIHLSTPTLPGYGISLDYEASDGRQGFWKCVKCNGWTCLEDHFPECLADPGVGEPFYLCMKCRDPLERRESEWAWVAARPSITDHRGYALSQMCSLRRTAGDILYEYEESGRSNKPGAVREFYNQVLGRPYAEIDDQLNDALIDDCIDTDRVRSKSSRGPCAMGVDPGARDMHYVVGDRITGTDSRVLDWGKCNGFEEIGQIAKKYHVQCGVMDQGAESRMVRAFCGSRPAWYGCHYSESTTAGYNWTPKDSHVSVNRTEALDAAHQAVLAKRVSFPAKDEVYHQTINGQLKSLARIEIRNDQTGSIKHRWVVTGGVKNDHIAHAHAYFHVALEKTGLSEQIRRARRPARKKEHRSFMAS